jgi:hypothetical protein
MHEETHIKNFSKNCKDYIWEKDSDRSKQGDSVFQGYDAVLLSTRIRTFRGHYADPKRQEPFIHWHGFISRKGSHASLISQCIKERT